MLRCNAFLPTLSCWKEPCLPALPMRFPELLRLAPDTKVIVQALRRRRSETPSNFTASPRRCAASFLALFLQTCFVKCVRKIAQGETWIDNQSVSWVIEAYRSNAAALTNPRVQPRLSPKEHAIIHGITQGKRNKEIANQIGTTEQVIKNYLRKIYDKLGVSDRLELALYCLHHQLTPNGQATIPIPAKPKEKKEFLRFAVCQILCVNAFPSVAHCTALASLLPSDQ